MSETTTMLVSDPRSRKRTPLKHSLLFNKAKHREEWHQAIDAIAGVLHPADFKFPYLLLRQATDVYLAKKGKITQTDASIRLSILIDAHQAKDIAVAAAAHAMTASSLRALLQVDLNVAHGSYWGLETWLQCLVAANYGNPASVTELEALWARHLLPFATHGHNAAGKILIGIARALRECATQNMNMVPEFLTLTIRALDDYAAQLEGYRLQNNWVAAHAASAWLAALGRASPDVLLPSSLSLEHILDAKFPVWRVWARWRPDLGRLARLSRIDTNSAAVLPDLLALEGPDFASGMKPTLRDGVVERYGSKRAWVKCGALVVEVPDGTKEGLRGMLETSLSTLENTIRITASANRPRLMQLLVKLVVAFPITQETLNLINAVLDAQKEVGDDAVNALFHIHTESDDLGGRHIMYFQLLVKTLDYDCAHSLHKILLTPKTVRGITRCIEDCQSAIIALIKQGQPWIQLSLEFHTFCMVLRNSKSVPVVEEKVLSQMCLLLPSAEHMNLAVEIYETVRTSDSPRRYSNVTEAETTNSNCNRDRTPAPSFLTGNPKRSTHPLLGAVTQHCLHRLLAQEEPIRASQRMFNLVLSVWESKSAPATIQDRRTLAVLVTEITSENIGLGNRCLAGIASAQEHLAPGLSVKDVLTILQTSKSEPDKSIVKFIELLANCSFVQDFKAQLLCWRDLAYHLLVQEHQLGIFKERDLLRDTLRTMKVAGWLSFLTRVDTVFATGPTLASEETDVPPVLRAELQTWRARLEPYTETLSRLEATLGVLTESIEHVLVCAGASTPNFVSILRNLKLVEGETVEPFIHEIAGLWSTTAKKAWEVADCVLTVTHADSETIETCKKIWDANHGYLFLPGLPPQQPGSHPAGGSKEAARSATCHSATSSKQTLPLNSSSTKYDVPPSVVEVMVAGWLLDNAASETTKNAVHSIACLLNIVQPGFDISKDQIIQAATFWQGVEDEMILEAKRLEQMRRALKTKDPRGTTLLLKQIGVPDMSELDEEIIELPAGVRDVVERIGDNEVEISFSLAAFTQLQRAAMGIPEAANMLLLRMFLDHSREMTPSFCLHYNNDPNLETIEHAQYVCSSSSEAPTKQICKTVETAFTWQLTRKIHAQLRTGKPSIMALHKQLSVTLLSSQLFCVSCGTSHNTPSAQLRRSTPCDLISCAQLWYALPLHVRIPEIRTDTFAVDILLLSIYAAAMTGKAELLPNCPIRSSEAVKAILNALPTMAIMRDAVDLSSVINRYHPAAEKLISWAVVHHRGFLATATGLLKIPNLPPGTHQFVLTNASPKLENTFISKLPKKDAQTTVLFHGTSLDRLPAILAQGLRVCSGTSLQRTGAAHGNGIYLSDEPATSFHYSPASLSWKNSGLSNMRMVLGCEVIGPGNLVSGNIHLVNDVESVMVRYVLLFTKDARMPIRGHVEPAMASGMRALRSGAV
ncbi:GID complex subunit containing RING finger motif [Neodidymelliopsis sp. IMI 364377]|nr:GID complex subunit containing RING finger motif [Neodidymelliopsis sp. IMI 364377]